MKRKLNRTMRSGLFQTIAMKLVRAKLEAFNELKEKLAVELYQWKYNRHTRAMSALPENAFNYIREVRFSDFSVVTFNVNAISNFFLPEKQSHKVPRSRWSSPAEKIYMRAPAPVLYCDQHRISVDKKNLPVRLKKKAEALKKKGIKLEKETDILLCELRAILNSCPTVAQLRKVLPEFSEFYPSDEVDSLPAVIANSTLVKSAAGEWSKQQEAAA